MPKTITFEHIRLLGSTHVLFKSDIGVQFARPINTLTAQGDQGDQYLPYVNSIHVTKETYKEVLELLERGTGR